MYILYHEQECDCLLNTASVTKIELNEHIGGDTITFFGQPTMDELGECMTQVIDLLQFKDRNTAKRAFSFIMLGLQQGDNIIDLKPFELESNSGEKALLN